MLNAYAWIFIAGIILFFTLTVVLLFFTRSVIELPLHSGADAEFNDWPVETEELIAGLPEDARLSYERAKIWQDHHPPDSIPTDITPPQFVTIQEKGVSAFEFEWEPDTHCFVTGRTEVQFSYGESCVVTNLPLPRNQEVYYWEAKMFEKPDTTTVSVGVCTKPYPSWRLPGWNQYSIGYFSDNGAKYFSSPFNGKTYGLPFNHGDVIGVGYRHRSGTLFFTRNGRKIEDAYTGLRWNLFPAIGANGPCQVHVNLGQRGFVFVEANVKKWGLAPSQGTLAPPPAYGLENDTILLEAGASTSTSDQPHRPTRTVQDRDVAQDAILITLDQEDEQESHRSTPSIPSSSPPTPSSLQPTQPDLIPQPSPGSPSPPAYSAVSMPSDDPPP
ncbi:SPRY-domain-containing protein [Hesseltinella vesiculosa]|uniref:SPRY-domain-containing protein n=1 Tax=Hesseltinella vesiculosa TaxID=101127 RepID=A0A1X2GSH1_9FUNG|nr:SPRY-domain-containing protein [Hesseltinella vesiculosa]